MLMPLTAAAAVCRLRACLPVLTSFFRLAGHLFRFSEDSMWWINCAVGNYAERAYK
jgi:uncharacterized membrane protein YcfT